MADPKNASTPLPAEIRESFLDTGRLRMRVLSCGDERGPVVLLLHGFPELAESWIDVMTRLADDGFSVAAPDLRGYGGTDAPADGYDLDSLAEDVAALVRTLGRGPVGLVGHDWGGAIAFHVAATRPEVVSRLAVVNAPHPAVMARRVWRPAQLRRSWYMLFFQLPWIPERALTKGGGVRVARLIRSASVDRSRLTDERLAAHVRAFSSPDKARAPLAYYRAAFRGLLDRRGRERHARYPRIAAPFRLIWGTRDVALGLELTRDLERWFEHPVDVRYLDDVGHFAPIEAPERVAPLLSDHFRSLPGESRPPRSAGHRTGVLSATTTSAPTPSPT